MYINCFIFKITNEWGKDHETDRNNLKVTWKKCRFQKGMAIHYLPGVFNHAFQLLKGIHDFPGDTVVKNLPTKAVSTRDMSSIPGSGRSPGVENGNPLQYSYLENSTARGAWQATAQSHKEWLWSCPAWLSSWAPAHTKTPILPWSTNTQHGNKAFQYLALVYISNLIPFFLHSLLIFGLNEFIMCPMLLRSPNTLPLYKSLSLPSKTSITSTHPQPHFTD